MRLAFASGRLTSLSRGRSPGLASSWRRPPTDALGKRARYTPPWRSFASPGASICLWSRFLERIQWFPMFFQLLNKNSPTFWTFLDLFHASLTLKITFSLGPLYARHASASRRHTSPACEVGGRSWTYKNANLLKTIEKPLISFHLSFSGLSDLSVSKKDFGLRIVWFCVADRCHRQLSATRQERCGAETSLRPLSA